MEADLIRTISVAVLALALALAGCLGTEEAPDASGGALEPADTESQSAAAMRGSNPSAPSMGGTETRTLETSVAFEGETPTGGCVYFAITGFCETKGGNYFQELKAGGEPSRLHLTVTSDSDDPLRKGIGAMLFVKSEGNAWYHYGDEDPSAFGDSPLELIWDLTPYAGKTLAVGVYSQWNGAYVLAGGGSATVGTPFAAEGTYTTQVAEGSSA